MNKQKKRNTGLGSKRPKKKEIITKCQEPLIQGKTQMQMPVQTQIPMPQRRTEMQMDIKIIKSKHIRIMITTYFLCVLQYPPMEEGKGRDNTISIIQ